MRTTENTAPGNERCILHTPHCATKHIKSLRYRADLKVIWEHVVDPDARLNVRRAIELILADPLQHRLGDFDRRVFEDHDEGVPVENTTQMQQDQCRKASR